MKLDRILTAALAFLLLASSPAAADPVVAAPAANVSVISAEPPSEASLRLDRAALATRAGDKKAALAALAEAETLNPAPIILRGIALLYQDLNEFPQARAAIKTLIKASPKDARLLVDLASIEARAEDRASALTSLAAARGLKPDAGERQRMVRLYLHLKEHGPAKILLDELIKESPSDIGLRLDRAALAALTGDAKAALALLAEARALGPDRTALHRMAILHQELKDYAGALALLEPLAKETPEAAILGDLGVCKHLAGRSDEAVADLRAAIKLDPKHLTPYLTLGSIYAGRKEFASELAVYESAPPAAGDAALRGLLAQSRREAAAHAAPRVEPPSAPEPESSPTPLEK